MIIPVCFLTIAPLVAAGCWLTHRIHTGHADTWGNKGNKWGTFGGCFAWGLAVPFIGAMLMILVSMTLDTHPVPMEGKTIVLSQIEDRVDFTVFQTDEHYLLKTEDGKTFRVPVSQKVMFEDSDNARQERIWQMTDSWFIAFMIGSRDFAPDVNNQYDQLVLPRDVKFQKSVEKITFTPLT